MTLATDGPPARDARSPSLWIRQGRAVAGLEIRKSFIGRRALIIYGLAAAPVALMAFAAIVAVVQSAITGATEPLDDEVYAAIFQVFILRWCIFFGCVAIFMNLFRGEVLDRSLHHYFLSPIRRDVLAVAKFASGLIAAVVLFGWSTIVSMLLTYVPWAIERPVTDLVTMARVEQMLLYLLVTALACLGYGALFLAIGLFFRNPVLPALVVLAWESIVFLLPPGLKQISVVHYLEALMPIPMSEGPFAIVAQPMPPWQAVVGLTVFSAALVAIAGLRVRRMEIDYSAD